MFLTLPNIWSPVFKSIIISFPHSETSKYGILELDEDLKVQRMKEKPLLSETSSRNAVCFHLYLKIKTFQYCLSLLLQAISLMCFPCFAVSLLLHVFKNLPSTSGHFSQ